MAEQSCSVHGGLKAEQENDDRERSQLPDRDHGSDH